MIPSIRKSDYVKIELPQAAQNEQENPAEIVVPAGVRREGNREATTAPGQNRQTDFVVRGLVKKPEVRELRAVRA
jgi:hypothetical protein